MAPWESLFSVAQKYELSIQELLNSNSYIHSPEHIYPNQVLIIPEKSAPKNESSMPPDVRETQSEAISEAQPKALPEIQPEAQPQAQPTIRKLSRIYSGAEIDKTEDILEVTTGLRTMLMRPPYGAVNGDALEQLIEMGYFIINWSVDSVDWRDQDVDSILINFLPDVRDGAIILFHSARGTGENPAATAEALPELIETLCIQDYTFVTVDELLNIPPYR